MAWVTGPHSEAPPGVLVFGTNVPNMMTWDDGTGDGGGGDAQRLGEPDTTPTPGYDIIVGDHTVYPGNRTDQGALGQAVREAGGAEKVRDAPVGARTTGEANDADRKVGGSRNNDEHHGSRRRGHTEGEAENVG